MELVGVELLAYIGPALLVEDIMFEGSLDVESRDSCSEACGKVVPLYFLGRACIQICESDARSHLSYQF